MYSISESISSFVISIYSKGTIFSFEIPKGLFDNVKLVREQLLIIVSNWKELIFKISTKNSSTTTITLLSLICLIP